MRRITSNRFPFGPCFVSIFRLRYFRWRRLSHRYRCGGRPLRRRRCGLDLLVCGGNCRLCGVRRGIDRGAGRRDGREACQRLRDNRLISSLIVIVVGLFVALFRLRSRWRRLRPT